jgi:hypothetical protein
MELETRNYLWNVIPYIYFVLLLEELSTYIIFI